MTRVALLIALLRPAAAQEPPPACRPEASAVRVEGRVTLRVMRGPGVDEARALAVVEQMRAFWAPLGLELALAGPTVEVPERAMLGADRETLAEALRAAGIDPDATGGDPDQALRVGLAVMLGPLRGFVDRHARPARREVLVVLLPNIAAPGSAAAAWFTDLSGLSFSPTLQSRLAEGEAAMREMVPLGEGYTPVVFLSTTALEARPPGVLPLTPAHELGHALGLPHVADPANLMARDQHRCWPLLTAEQAAALVLPGAPPEGQR